MKETSVRKTARKAPATGRRVAPQSAEHEAPATKAAATPAEEPVRAAEPRPKLTQIAYDER